MSPVMVRILAVVGIIISFVFMGLLYGYNEQLYASLNAHCDISGERVHHCPGQRQCRRLFQPAGRCQLGPASRPARAVYTVAQRRLHPQPADPTPHWETPQRNAGQWF